MSWGWVGSYTAGRGWQESQVLLTLTNPVENVTRVTLLNCEDGDPDDINSTAKVLCHHAGCMVARWLTSRPVKGSDVGLRSTWQVLLISWYLAALQVAVPSKELVLAGKDAAAEYDELAEPQEFQDDPEWVPLLCGPPSVSTPPLKWRLRRRGPVTRSAVGIISDLLLGPLSCFDAVMLFGASEQGLPEFLTRSGS